ncbi:hypothetical protein [Lonepinella sp. BR2357]|uniref:hypothetical protein n=1 Tax=Lonepinella sp. BR2357 TaxID=3434549 RepID=UPI003F6E278A
MKKYLFMLLTTLSYNVMADYALVSEHSSWGMNPVVQSKTLEQCQQNKANFEAVIQQDEQKKKRYNFHCIELAQSSTI